MLFMKNYSIYLMYRRNKGYKGNGKDEEDEVY